MVGFEGRAALVIYHRGTLPEEKKVAVLHGATGGPGRCDVNTAAKEFPFSARETVQPGAARGSPPQWDHSMERTQHIYRVFTIPKIILSY